MNKTLTLHSPAKVNLTLDVLGYDQAIGYHRMQSVMHEIPELFDELTVTVTQHEGVTLECEHPDVPLDERNTILQAVEALKHFLKKSKRSNGPSFPGLHITLKKNIPLKAGFGGGSSNAATTLKALNQLWTLDLNTRQLRTVAARIGMDVPFFITGGAAMAMHYGEQLMHLPTLQERGLQFTLVPLDTGIQIATEEAYATLDLARCGRNNRDTGRLVRLLKGSEDLPADPQEQLDWLNALCHNDFDLASPFGPSTNQPRSSDPADPPAASHLTGTGGGRFVLSPSKNPKPNSHVD